MVLSPARMIEALEEIFHKVATILCPASQFFDVRVGFQAFRTPAGEDIYLHLLSFFQYLRKFDLKVIRSLGD